MNCAFDQVLLQLLPVSQLPHNCETKMRPSSGLQLVVGIVAISRLLGDCYQVATDRY